MVRDLNLRLLAQLKTVFQSTIEQHKLGGKTSRDTVVSIERFQAMTALVGHLMGKDGEKKLPTVSVVQTPF